MHLKQSFKSIASYGGNALPPTGVIDLKQSFKSIAFGYMLYKEGNALPSVIYYITEGNRSIASKFCKAKQSLLS